VLAPSLALAWSAATGRAPPIARRLFPATVLQLAALWALHAPPILTVAMQRPAMHLVFQTALLGCAVWFWLAIFAARGQEGWRSILALLVTAKLFCLLGVILVFAPRALYASMHASADHTLADQQLAGLLMLTACPLTYLVAGVAIAARWLGALPTAASRPIVESPTRSA
jgi:putative membrane protein